MSACFTGYDLAQVNLYINKVFENVGGLVYEETEDSDKCIFQVKGVQSALGEKLPFKEVCGLSIFIMNRVLDIRHQLM